MKILALILLMWTAQATAHMAPQTVVAQTTWPHTESITLLVDPCNARSGTLRAQRVTRDRTVIWGCWGYNPTGVQIAWATGRTEFIDWIELTYQRNGMGQPLGYQSLHERVTLLRSQF